MQIYAHNLQYNNKALQQQLYDITYSWKKYLDVWDSSKDTVESQPINSASSYAHELASLT